MNIIPQPDYGLFKNLLLRFFLPEQHDFKGLQSQR